MQKVIGKMTTGVVAPGTGAAIAAFKVAAVTECGDHNFMLLLEHDSQGNGFMYSLALTTSEGVENIADGSLANLATVASMSEHGNDLRGAVAALRKTADALELIADQRGV